MEYRHLGNAGLQVSVLGLGTNSFGSRCEAEQSLRVIHQALDLGVNHIDTANMYSEGRSEEIIGSAIKGRRHDAIIGTKFGLPMGRTSDNAYDPGTRFPNRHGASRKHIMDELEDSLRRLGVDYVDIYWLHIYDDETPAEETMRALDNIVRQGKARYIGCSNIAAWQVCEAIWTSRTLNLNAFVTVQQRYNLVTRDPERELLPLCREYGLGFIPYYPLESGLLTGKYKAGQPFPEGSRMDIAPYYTYILTERNLAIVTALERFAEERGHTMVQLAIAWLAANPTVSSVITGAMTPEQVTANAKGVEWRLTAEDMAAIDEIAPTI